MIPSTPSIAQVSGCGVEAESHPQYLDRVDNAIAVFEQLQRSQSSDLWWLSVTVVFHSFCRNCMGLMVINLQCLHFCVQHDIAYCSVAQPSRSITFFGAAVLSVEPFWLGTLLLFTEHFSPALFFGSRCGTSWYVRRPPTQHTPIYSMDDSITVFEQLQRPQSSDLWLVGATVDGRLPQFLSQTAWASW